MQGDRGSKLPQLFIEASSSAWYVLRSKTQGSIDCQAWLYSIIGRHSGIHKWQCVMRGRSLKPMNTQQLPELTWIKMSKYVTWDSIAQTKPQSTQLGSPGHLALGLYLMAGSSMRTFTEEWTWIPPSRGHMSRPLKRFILSNILRISYLRKSALTSWDDLPYLSLPFTLNYLSVFDDRQVSPHRN